MNNIVITLAPLLIFGFSSSLQVTKATIKSLMGSKFYQIRIRIAELTALEGLENPHRLIIGEML